MKTIRKILLFFIIPLSAFAQLPSFYPSLPGSVRPISDVSEFGTIIQSVLSFFGSLIFAVSVFIFLYAGFLYVTAGDNEDNVSKAKSYLTYGIVGLIIALVAFSIPLLISTITQLGAFS